jgi:hypothetical protein
LVVEGLETRFKECIPEKNCTLIRYDIIQDLKNLYDEIKDETIRKKALELIELEEDLKYRKSIPVYGKHKTGRTHPCGRAIPTLEPRAAYDPAGTPAGRLGACDHLLAWTVKDVAAHLLGGNLGRLWMEKASTPSEALLPDYDELVGFINRENETWVQAARRISPEILIEFLDLTDRRLYEHFRNLDPNALAVISVAWAGEDLAPHWLTSPVNTLKNGCTSSISVKQSICLC